MATVGIIVNPRAGKDIRGLVASASVPSDGMRVAELRRIVLGAVEGGADRVLVARDPQGMTRRALGGLDDDLPVEELALRPMGTSVDSARAAAVMQRSDVDVVVVLGGDGTHRDVCLGWPDAPIVSVGVGSTNAFGQQIEPTVAGTAAGLVASGIRPLADLVAWQALAIHLDVEGETSDLALTNLAVLVSSSATSSTVWEIDGVTQILAAVAEPWTVGLSAVAGLVAPTSRTDDRAVLLSIDPDSPRRVRAPVAPGSWVDVGIGSVSVVEPGQRISIVGPAVLAFDGERRRALAVEQRAVASVRRTGLRVIDVRRTFAHAVGDGRFVSDPPVVAVEGAGTQAPPTDG